MSQAGIAKLDAEHHTAIGVLATFTRDMHYSECASHAK